MSCQCDILTSGIRKGCENNIAGIRKLWLYETCDSTVAEGSPTGYKELTLATGKLYKFEFNKGTSSFTENLTGDEATGSQFYTQTITLKLTRREKSKRAVLIAMSRFEKVGAVVEDN